VPLWSSVLCGDGCGVRKVLEIGSYEGRSAVWVIENVLRDGGELFCLDIWAPGPVHGEAEMGQAEIRFDANLDRALRDRPGIGFRKLTGSSWNSLARLTTDGHAGTFDFIYIDGSHQTPDVLADLVGAFPLCKTGGFIFCDDYLGGSGGEDPLSMPKLGIDSFVNCFRKKLRILNMPLYQLYLQKIAD
jgi:predicted O-methyltransferase YrrM